MNTRLSPGFLLRAIRDRRSDTTDRYLFDSQSLRRVELDYFASSRSLNRSEAAGDFKRIQWKLAGEYVATVEEGLSTMDGSGTVSTSVESFKFVHDSRCVLDCCTLTEYG